MNTKELNKKFGIKKCVCGKQLIPRKSWFKNVIIYKCPNSNILNKKNHSISRAFFAKVKTLKIGMK